MFHWASMFGALLDRLSTVICHGTWFPTVVWVSRPKIPNLVAGVCFEACRGISPAFRFEAVVCLNRMRSNMASGSAISTAFASWKRLVKNRNVAWLWTGQAISQIGDGLSKVALLWFVYDLTGSALKMTMIGILQTIPPLVFGPFAGVLLDRVSKRMAMIIIDSIRAGLLVVIPTLYWMGLLTLPWLYVLVFFTATFSMAFGPALKAMEPLLVKSDQLTQINA